MLIRLASPSFPAGKITRPGVGTLHIGIRAEVGRSAVRPRPWPPAQTAPDLRKLRSIFLPRSPADGQFRRLFTGVRAHSAHGIARWILRSSFGRRLVPGTPWTVLQPAPAGRRSAPRTCEVSQTGAMGSIPPIRARRGREHGAPPSPRSGRSASQDPITRRGHARADHHPVDHDGGRCRSRCDPRRPNQEGSAPPGRPDGSARRPAPGRERHRSLRDEGWTCGARDRRHGRRPRETAARRMYVHLLADRMLARVARLPPSLTGADAVGRRVTVSGVTRRPTCWGGDVRCGGCPVGPAQPPKARRCIDDPLLSRV